MSTETKTGHKHHASQYREEHHDHHRRKQDRYESEYNRERAETHRRVVQQNGKIRRRKVWKNIKRIAFIIFISILLIGVLYYLANPEAEIKFFEPNQESKERRIQELEKEIEELQKQLDNEKSAYYAE